MAKEYYFIPKIYEAALAAGIDSWTSDSESWIIISGVYKASDILNTDDTTVYSVDRVSLDKTYIKKGLVDMFGNNKTLIGFGLEGDLDTLAPEAEAALMLLERVVEFSEGSDFAIYVNSL